MITEFKKHNVKSEDFDLLEDKIDDKYLKLKLEDSKKILEKYQSRISENYIDEADSLEILADNIEKSNLFNDAIFYIDEFAGFTPSEYQVIDKLCRIARNDYYVMHRFFRKCGKRRRKIYFILIILLEKNY